MKESYFAVDLGAGSGRTILANVEAGKLEMEEINRFPNHIIETGGHCYWDILALYRHILEGLKIVAARKEIHLASIGIDAWGVDFMLLGKDGSFLRQPYSYRDAQTAGAPEAYFSRVSRELLYRKTGIQFMDFNSIFQFDTLSRTGDSAWEAADKILFIPDALSYLLTGNTVTEYTVATTAQIVNAATRKLDPQILATVGLDENHFGEFVYPGHEIGTLTTQVQELTGLGPVPVLAVAGHDTASAVAAVPAQNADFAYLSSGTWSLMGVELPAPVISPESEKENFTNEGGISGTVRFLKNICGMWLLESCRKVWGPVPYEQLIAEAGEGVPFRSLVNPDDVRFVHPADMVEALQEYCLQTGQPVPESRGQVVRCIFESLAFRYREVLDKLRNMAPVRINVLHIIGGGSRNDLLNQFTANAVGIPVIAGPSEATAIGNVLVQAMATGTATGLPGMRKILSDSISTVTYEPQDTSIWADAYQRYLVITH